MKEVKVNVKKTLAMVRENKNKHDFLYEVSCDAYWRKAEEVLKESLEKIYKKKQISTYLDLPFPPNHASDYERVIKMLEMSVDKSVVLDDVSFSKFILNNWDWKQEFVRITRTYLGYTGPSGIEGYSGYSGYSGHTPEETLESF